MTAYFRRKSIYVIATQKFLKQCYVTSEIGNRDFKYFKEKKSMF
jgi:frataxin-like iron-binding protein CyaY